MSRDAEFVTKSPGVSMIPLVDYLLSDRGAVKGRWGLRGRVRYRLECSAKSSQIASVQKRGSKLIQEVLLQGG